MPEFKNAWIENNMKKLDGLSENQISRKYDLHLSAIYKNLPPQGKKQYDDKASDFQSHLADSVSEREAKAQKWAHEKHAEAKKNKLGSDEFNYSYSGLENEDGSLANVDLTAMLRKAAEIGATEEGDKARGLTV